jgi:Domain of unknown function (DUF5666)
MDVVTRAVLFTGIAFAHGDEGRVMGTITNVTDTAITVEVAGKETDAPKKSVTVTVVASTKFEKNGAAATIRDLKVGDRVAIHAGKNEDLLEAHTVKIGTKMGSARHN